MDLKCPVCHKSTRWKDNKWRPFCSERCKLIDLGEWATEGYLIRGENDSTWSEDNQGIKEDNTT
ncbi:DNA gyrase inhibitor YacG [bacterium BMS3Bbin05]|nr:DNA gyrase inhibitor YacG [bacterium BMS3Bbin05]HDL20042.1 DNA gyrase inhibitor YacG [Nitrospirota bacterium]HDO23072.1 DNA gyrase inhibitor YacG [Nitrospirota bacterium]HDZ87755.1 DNA gyrase inhibitor YacG [Nitrospirota bacterium]